MRCDLQIFSGCVCHLEQLHAQSPFLFPIVFSINLIPFFDICSVDYLLFFHPGCSGMCCFTWPLRGRNSTRCCRSAKLLVFTIERLGESGATHDSQSASRSGVEAWVARNLNGWDDSDAGLSKGWVRRPSGLANLHHSRLSTRSSYQLYSFSGDRRFCHDNHGSFVYDSPNLFCGPSGSVRTGLARVRSEPGHRTYLTSLIMHSNTRQAVRVDAFGLREMVLGQAHQRTIMHWNTRQALNASTRSVYAKWYWVNHAGSPANNHALEHSTGSEQSCTGSWNTRQALNASTRSSPSAQAPKSAPFRSHAATIGKQDYR